MQVDSSLREIVSLREQLDLKTSSADDMRHQLDRLAESLAEKDVEVELLQDQLRLTDTEKVRLDEEKQKVCWRFIAFLLLSFINVHDFSDHHVLEFMIEVLSLQWLSFSNLFFHLILHILVAFGYATSSRRVE